MSFDHTKLFTSHTIHTVNYHETNQQKTTELDLRAYPCLTQFTILKIHQHAYCVTKLVISCSTVVQHRNSATDTKILLVGYFSFNTTMSFSFSRRLSSSLSFHSQLSSFSSKPHFSSLLFIFPYAMMEMEYLGSAEF